MKLRKMMLAAMFAALTAVGAFINIPAGPVPITLQFLFTAVAGALLGEKWGLASQAVYLVLGLAGLPIFSNGGGISYVFQPSFGFLLALVPSAYVMALLIKKNSSFTGTLLAAFAADLMLYVAGVPYMYIILKLHLGRSVTVASLLKGLLMFVPGDLIKIAVLSLLLPALIKRIPQLRDGSE